MDKSEIEKLDKHILNTLKVIKPNGKVSVSKGLKKNFGSDENQFALWYPIDGSYQVTQKANDFYFDKQNSKQQQMYNLLIADVEDFGIDGVIQLLGGIPVPLNNDDYSRLFIKWNDYPEQYFEEILEYFITRQISSRSDIAYAIMDMRKKNKNVPQIFDGILKKLEKEGTSVLTSRISQIRKMLSED